MENRASESSRVEAVLLDVLGTLVRMEPPAPRLRAALRRLAGVEVSEQAAAAAFRAEIDYYLAHHLEGRDRDSLEALRDRCASILAEALGLGREVAREAMLASIAFAPYPDAAPALRALRQRGVRLVAASNWDHSLPEVLARVRLAPLLDGVVSSAAVGAAKPSAALFDAALEVAAAAPAHAVHVGDSRDHDVEGARAAGIAPILLVRPPRDRSAGAPSEGAPTALDQGTDVVAIASLDELPSVI